jgi:hypothetical protein
MRRQPPSHDTLLAAFMLALAIVSIAFPLLSTPSLTITLPRGLVGATSRSVEARPRDGAEPVAEHSPAVDAEESTRAQPAPVAVLPAPAAEIVTEESDPPAARLEVGGRARVVNTDGAGVVLHAAPRAGARRPAGLLDGTAVAVLELVGEEWARVQSDSKLAGWVPAAYLAPVD